MCIHCFVCISSHTNCYHCFVGSSAPSQLSTVCEEATVNSPTQEDTMFNLEWTGFKIVGDNIDKTAKPRHVRFDRQTKSLHYFHAYAVKDRVNFANESDSPPVPPDTPDLLSLTM